MRGFPETPLRIKKLNLALEINTANRELYGFPD
jgi:hypothetical protein